MSTGICEVWQQVYIILQFTHIIEFPFPLIIIKIAIRILPGNYLIQHYVHGNGSRNVFINECNINIYP